MEIKINAEETVKSVKDAFNKEFPNLKVEFFRHAHQEGEGSPKKDMVRVDETISNLSPKDSNGTLTYSKDTIISDFEQQWEQQFGLNVQVFRKASLTWLETINSDSWTLEQANKHSEEMYQDE